MRRLKAAGVIALGLLLSAGAVALVLASDHEEEKIFVIVTLLLSAWSFILGGLLAWARRPDNRFGPLLCAVGLTVFIGALGASNSSLPFTVGFVFEGLFIAVFIHALMAFPRGYLETRIVYAIVAIAYLALTVGSFVVSLFYDVSRDCAECPSNAFLIVDSPTAVTAIDAVLIAVGIPALLAALYVFRRRWYAAPAPLKRLLLPVYLTAGATLVLLGIGLVVGAFSENGGRLVAWITTLHVRGGPARASSSASWAAGSPAEESANSYSSWARRKRRASCGKRSRGRSATRLCASRTGSPKPPPLPTWTGARSSFPKGAGSSWPRWSSARGAR